MTLPRFTAEASVGPTTQTYRVYDRYGVAAASVQSQANGGEEVEDYVEDDLEEAVEAAEGFEEQDIDVIEEDDIDEDVVEEDVEEEAGDEP